MDDRQDVAVYEGSPGWMAPAIIFLTLVAVAGPARVNEFETSGHGI
ncbi:MAG TPA: hypothetical protein VE957_22335 [Terriglobales bacterium]|nr:hypothetical protein [Terriglobales bacterium]